MQFNLLRVTEAFSCMRAWLQKSSKWPVSIINTMSLILVSGPVSFMNSGCKHSETSNTKGKTLEPFTDMNYWLFILGHLKYDDRDLEELKTLYTICLSVTQFHHFYSEVDSFTLRPECATSSVNKLPVILSYLSMTYFLWSLTSRKITCTVRLHKE